MTKKQHRSRSVARIAVFAFLIIYLFALVIPFVWGVITSFKSALDFRDNMFGLPKKWEFSNYVTVFDSLKTEFTDPQAGIRKTFYFEQMLFNSLAYSLISAFVATLTTYIVAYAVNHYDFKFLKIIDVIVLVTMALPIVGSLPSSIQIMKTFGLYQNFFGMTVIAKASFLGTYYFVVGAAIRGIPRAYSEAAEIDGAGELSVLVRVVLPLTASIFFTVFIIKFIDFWNDYQTPYVFLRNFPTAAYGLWAFKNSGNAASARVSLKLAACFIVVTPVLLVFIIFHKRLMNGISLSEGVKE